MELARRHRSTEERRRSANRRRSTSQTNYRGQQRTGQSEAFGIATKGWIWATYFGEHPHAPLILFLFLSHLHGQVALVAQLLNLVNLGFQPIHVLFLVF